MLTASKDFRKRIINLTRSFSVFEQKIWLEILKPVSRESKVLEVGCGKCSKTRLLKKIGFKSILGVEKNSELVLSAVENGFHVVDVNTFEKDYCHEEYDLLILSHIIEHFSFENMISFVNGYLKCIKPGGIILIATPVLHNHFWLDLDHIKPYYPHGIKNFFGSSDEQVQFLSPYKLKLKDIRFRRGPFKIKLSRSLLLKKNDIPPLFFNFMSAILFKFSKGIIGHTTGWVGLYKKN